MSGEPSGPLAAGSPAPEFTLHRHDGTPFTRDDLLGHRTVLVFYPFAFSPVCTDQLSLYNELLEDFRAQGATLYGVSCDATYSQTAFREHLHVDIEQLSDFEPKGETCRTFGVLHPGGFPQRALVLIEPDGVISWSFQAPTPGDLPGANLIRRARRLSPPGSDLGSAPVPAPQPDDHLRGPEAAPLLIAYADFECPFCAQLAARLHGTPYRHVFRHFPVRSSHPRAWAAAAAAEAAARQDRFWAMHDLLFADPGRLEDPHLWQRAEALGLDVERFEGDRRSDAVAARIARDFRGGVRGGVVTTPTVFLDGLAHAGRAALTLLSARSEPER